MNVLLVSQAYPPYAIVGAQRSRKVAEMLRGRGHRVFVITERLEDEGPELRASEAGCEVYTVALKPQYRLRLLRLIRRRSSGSVNEGSVHQVASAVGQESVGRTSGLLRRVVLSLLLLPDDELRFVVPALRIARRLMQKHKIDLVYTTSPPHSSHLVGLRLRASSQIRWVAEFRDPWTAKRTPQRIEHWFGPLEAVHRWLERRCLSTADYVVTVTRSTGDLLANKLPEEQRRKVVVALNGVERQHARRLRERDEPFRILHAGTFYLDRDPRPFLRALADIRRERGLGPKDVQVDFLGRCRFFGGISVEKEVEVHGLVDIVRFHDWIEPDEAQAKMRMADLLLLLACSQPIQVPNKLFDYLGSGVPVLGIVDADGESERMLRSVGGQFIVPVARGERASDKAIRASLVAALDAGTDLPSVTNKELLQEWSSSVQMERLAIAIGA